MICEAIQKESGMSASFEVVLGNSVIATAFLKNNFTFGGTWEYFSSDNLKYRLVYRPSIQRGNFLKSSKEKRFIPYEIQNERGEVVGIICQRQNGGFFNSYDYFELIINNVTYQMYAIGMGKEGQKFPIYIGDGQVALIEKDNVVYDNLDIYHICSVSSEANEVACLFSLYIDALMYGNRGEKMIKSVNKTYSLTINKTLKSKYNSEFKNNIQE